MVAEHPNKSKIHEYKADLDDVRETLRIKARLDEQYGVIANAVDNLVSRHKELMFHEVRAEVETVGTASELSITMVLKAPRPTLISIKKFAREDETGKLFYEPFGDNERLLRKPLPDCRIRGWRIVVDIETPDQAGIIRSVTETALPHAALFGWLNGRTRARKMRTGPTVPWFYLESEMYCEREEDMTLLVPHLKALRLRYRKVDVSAEAC